MILAMPPANVWPVGLLAWVPLVLVAAHGAPLSAALIGWIQGAIVEGAVLASLPGALRHNAGISVTGSFAMATLLVLWQGGRTGVVALVSARAVHNGWPLALAFPVSLVLAEWLYPMFFYWTTCLLFHGAPVLLQGAELGGPLVMSFWAGLIDASLTSAWMERANRIRLVRYSLALPAAALAIVFGYGLFRMRATDQLMAAAPRVRVGIVQGNVGESLPEEGDDPVSVYRNESIELLAEQKVDVLVWPETAIPHPVDIERLPEFFAETVLADTSQPSRKRIDVPLLTGVVLDRFANELAAHVHTRGPDGTWSTGKRERFNSAVLVAPDGRVRGVYDKRELVMFGEYLPAEGKIPELRRLMPWAGTFSAGSSSALLKLDGQRLLILICYEDTMPASVRTAVQEGNPDLLVNLTSDTWFGMSRVPWIHLALAKLRAIEHRRYLLRATNNGVSAVVDPAGRIVESLPPNRRSSMAPTVRSTRARTLYEVIGDAPWLLVAAIAAVLVTRPRYSYQDRGSTA